jgi:hydroxypyruvate reductase 1
MSAKTWQVYNEHGSKRVIVTKVLPGPRWLDILTQADCRIEVCTSPDILTIEEIRTAIGARCDGAIGQLTENWSEELFGALQAAGGSAYSNYAVGYNNVNVDVATAHGIAVGNTPGVLTETTAEMAVALTMAAARRVVEADQFMRGGHYHGWLPTLFMGNLLMGGTVGLVGAGRIGAAYGRMMVEGFKMNLVYYDPYPNKGLEAYVAAYSQFLEAQGEAPVTCTRLETVEAVLQQADVVSLHPVLDPTTHHLINAERLGLMKADAILVNASRGPVIDEAALVAHCQQHPDFRAGLDVFEDEPAMKPGLAELANVVIVPHIASATKWTREGMATLAASNVAAMLKGYPVWSDPNHVLPFLGDTPPQAAPSIVNAKAIGLPQYQG